MDNQTNTIQCPSCGLPNPINTEICEFCRYNIKHNTFKIDANLEILKRNLAPKYKIEKRIGKGGMATVYLGEQAELDRKIVVKLLNEDYSEDKEIRERFLQEAKTPARIKHPNLVEVIDVGEAEERPYYIMEYAPAGSLSDRLKKYKEENKFYPIKDALYVIERILRALHYCHQNKLASHRDIKPDNIMFRATGEPIIVDFGIAKVVGEFRTQTKMTLGTANYMSPEQCKGQKDIDGRSDVYAVGVMLFELVTGDVPFKGDSGISVMSKHVHNKMPSLSDQIKEIERNDSDFLALSKDLENVIKKACAKNREKRYQSAEEFANELTQLISRPQPTNNQVMNPASLTLFASMLLMGIGIGGYIGYTLFLKPKSVIQIDSNPTGAKVIDIAAQKEIGIAPVTIKKSDIGTYQYKISMKDHRDEIINIELKEVGKQETVLVYLHKILSEPNPNTTNPNDTKVIENKTVDPIDTKKPKFVTVNGVEWEVGEIPKMTWPVGFTHCKNKGLRLPAVKELQSIAKANHPDLKTPCCEYWAKEIDPNDKEQAYNVTISSGEDFLSPKSEPYYVRCVKK